MIIIIVFHHQQSSICYKTFCTFDRQAPCRGLKGYAGNISIALRTRALSTSVSNAKASTLDGFRAIGYFATLTTSMAETQTSGLCTLVAAIAFAHFGMGSTIAVSIGNGQTSFQPTPTNLDVLVVI